MVVIIAPTTTCSRCLTTDLLWSTDFIKNPSDYFSEPPSDAYNVDDKFEADIQDLRIRINTEESVGGHGGNGLPRYVCKPAAITEHKTHTTMVSKSLFTAGEKSSLRVLMVMRVILRMVRKICSGIIGESIESEPLRVEI
ncbi:hypothetical protein LXL04_021041 [Taraxacum kok-saghyz]